MKPSTLQTLTSSGFIVLGLLIGACGIHLGETDDAPGAALLGLLLMAAFITVGIRRFLRKQ